MRREALGNDTTDTSGRPDSAEAYATHRPSGEIRPAFAGLPMNGVGFVLGPSESTERPVVDAAMLNDQNRIRCTPGNQLVGYFSDVSAKITVSPPMPAALFSYRS